MAAFEILAYRWIWATVFFVVLSRILPRRQRVARTARLWATLALSGVLIGTNWFIYVYAVTSGHIIESSLGYFLSPMAQVLLGVVVLGERLSRASKLALFLAGAGIALLIAESYATAGAHFTVWIAVVLAISFSCYGLVRKRSGLDALEASTLEMLLGSPVAAGLLIFLFNHAPAAHHGSLNQHLLLAVGGVITGLPLLWYTEAAARIPLSQLGFFQYISPILQFALGVAVYHEEFGPSLVVGFGFIWVALCVYSWELFHRWSRSRAMANSLPRAALP